MARSQAGVWWECLQCRRDSAKRRKARQRAKSPESALHDYARQRARGSGVPFTITPEDIRAVWPPDDICPVLGVTMRVQRGKAAAHSPSLDRLNSAWGYERGNIVVMSLRANQGKRDLTAAEHRAIADWMERNGLA